MPEKKRTRVLKKKLSEVGKHFLDNQGLPVPFSTFPGIFKEKGRWLNIDIAGGGWTKNSGSSNLYYCIVLYLQPVLNPKSYDGARVLEASGRPMLVIGRSY